MSLLNFNPYRAGGAVTAPNASFGDVQKLLQGSQQGVDSALDNLIQVGKVQRSENVNDLIARGGLQGLNEGDARAKLLATAGGSLTEDANKNIADLLGLKRVESEREEARNVADLAYERDIDKTKLVDELTGKREDKKMTFEESLQDKKIGADTNLAKLKMMFDERQQSQDQDFKSKLLQQEYGYKTGIEDRKLKQEALTKAETRQYEESILNKKQKHDFDLLQKKAKVDMDSDTLKYLHEKQLAKGKQKVKDKELTDRDKLAIKNIKPQQVSNDYDAVVEEISEDMDSIWDRGFTPATASAVKGMLSLALNEPGAAAQYEDYGVDGLKNVLYDYMKKNDIKFNDPFWNPFEERALVDAKTKKK